MIPLTATEPSSCGKAECATFDSQIAVPPASAITTIVSRRMVRLSRERGLDLSRATTTKEFVRKLTILGRSEDNHKVALLFGLLEWSLLSNESPAL